MLFGYTRQEMEAIIDAGGSVLLPGGKLAVTKDELPTETQLAMHSDEQRQQRLATLGREIAEMQAELERLEKVPQPEEPPLSQEELREFRRRRAGLRDAPGPRPPEAAVPAHPVEGSGPADTGGAAGRPPGVGADRDGPSPTTAGRVAEFVLTECERREAAQVAVADLFEAWRSWCRRRGLEGHADAQAFGRDLRQLLPGLKFERPRTEGGGRQRVYVGLGLRDAPAPAPAGGEG